MLPRKYIEINNLKMAYSDIGSGDPVLLIHGFAAASFTWEALVSQLPANKRYIMLDLKGFGYSDKTLDNHFSPFYQAKILYTFVEKLKLKKITLVGHSFGGAVSILALMIPKMEKRVQQLILIDSAGYFVQLPPYIKQLRIPLANDLVFNYINSEILIRVILEELYADKSRIDDEYVSHYVSLLSLPGSIDCLIKSAEQISSEHPNKIADRLKKLKIPTLIVWGEKDDIIPLENAYRFNDDLRNSQLAVIPDCGHSPHEEKSKDTAAVISDFLNGKKIRIPDELPVSIMKSSSQTQKLPRQGDIQTSEKRKPRMSLLVDKWSFTIFLMFVFIKILQVLKTLGFKAKESGWRQTMGAYLRTEHSKFGLAVFGLDFLSDRGKLENISEEDARRHVIHRLSEFLRNSVSSKWKLRWGTFCVFRERHFFTDIIEVDFDDNGNIISLYPHFDITGPPFYEIDNIKLTEICRTFIEEYNRVKDVRDEDRPPLLRKNLKKWLKKKKNLSAIERQETWSSIDRILSGNSLIFDTLSCNASASVKARFTPPDFINYKHPGFGLLNIVCRFSHSLDESDMWFQFQHVPVDGVPMQEFLLTLKKQWGIRRELVYPSLANIEPVPPQRCSTLKDKRALYQTITFIDFRPLLKMRKMINNKYANEMGGQATVISLIMWGLTQHESLRDRKFIFPVELAECKVTGQERAPCAMFIRPSTFVNPKNPIKGFLDFQYEFNSRMNATRARKSESYELVELYALTFPLLYTFTRKIIPKALGEFIGTVGITMIKDADLFITPLSDVQSDGFFAIGNLLVPTEDGKKASGVSIRATKDKIPLYIDAFDKVQENLDNLLNNLEK